MLALDIGADVRLDPRNLPPLRLLSDADVEAALDDVGAHLADRLPVGVVAAAERTRVENARVVGEFVEGAVEAGVGYQDRAGVIRAGAEAKRVGCTNRVSCGQAVFVDQSAQPISAGDVVWSGQAGEP